MSLGDLKPLQVETGIIFGQECYLDPSRAREFHTKVNEIFPNFLTRYNYQQLPDRFTLENANCARRCVVQLNRFNYSVHVPIEPSDFLQQVEEIFDCFKNLFALDDVRRIGKIYDFQSPASLTKDSLADILKIQESLQVNHMELLFRDDGKNINIHFQSVDKGQIEFAGRRIALEPGVIIRCDINNIDMNSRLNFPDTLKEVFGYTDRYVQEDLLAFLDEYFGGKP